MIDVRKRRMTIPTKNEISEAIKGDWRAFLSSELIDV
jgi:hypothetical protein